MRIVRIEWIVRIVRIERIEWIKRMGCFYFLPILDPEYSGLSHRDKIWVEDCL